MAVSSQDIINFLLANPNMSDSAIAAAMDMYGVTPAMMAEAVGIPVAQVQQRYEEVQPQGLFTAQEPIKTPEPVYTPEPTPEPVYADPTYTDPFYAEPVEPAYVAPEPAYVTPEPIAQPTVTNQQIVDFIVANPTITDTQLAAVMQQYDVSPQQVAQATGTSIEEAQQRYEAVTQPVITPEPVATPVVAPVEIAPVAPPVAPLDTPVIKPEPQTTQEATTMAVTSKQIVDFLLANPNMTDAQIVGAMEQYGVSPAQMATAVGLKEGEVAARVGATLPPNEVKLLGDTYVQAVNQVTGSGEDQQVGALENVITYKASENKVGGDITYYTPEGKYQQTTKQQEVNATKDFLKFAAVAGGLMFGLPPGLGEAATIGSTGLTAAELALADLSLGGAGGTLGAETLASALTTGATVPTLTNLTGGSGLLTGEAAGITAQSVADKLAADAAAQAQAKIAADAAAQAAQAAQAAADAKAVADAAVGADAATKAAADAASAKAAADAAAAKTAADAAAAKVTSTAATTAAATGATTLANTATTAATALTASQVADLAKAGLTAAQIAQLVSSTAQTAGGLLQQQTSKEAADKARTMIDAETAAAKAGAQFRPIGMTTRFGSSQFVVDPTTGRLTSAGYTLDPQAKNAQDRFVKLAEQGLQQAEGAQAKFAPLQTGATSLFTLGNKYLAQTPESVASDYMKSQLALLAPGREQQYAFLQNQLQQQGRGGLSVAQGTGLAPTSPELAAFMNAKIQEDARLAANAQQYGQQQVAFGAGLLSQGAQTMGQYYGGQQAAYSPYTTAMGQVTGLETAAQQPFQMGVDLGKIGAATGFDAGRLGLQGAGQSVALATGPAATNNPYATLLTGAASSPVLTEALVKAFQGTTNETTAINPYFRTYG